jgi:hypothetical protein
MSESQGKRAEYWGGESGEAALALRRREWIWGGAPGFGEAAWLWGGGLALDRLTWLWIGCPGFG